MKRQTKIIITVFLVLLCICTWFLYPPIDKWIYINQHQTPEQYRSYYKNSHSQYTKDSLYLSHIIKLMRDSNIFSYNPIYYNFNSTVLIDTIIYNKTFDKLAIWGICISNDNNNSKVYCGGEYLAFRDSSTLKIRIANSYGPDYGRTSLYEIKELLRFNFFYDQHTWRTYKDLKPRYNWDDKRLWSGAINDDLKGENSYAMDDNNELIKFPPLDSLLFQR